MKYDYFRSIYLSNRLYALLIITVLLFVLAQYFTLLFIAAKFVLIFIVIGFAVELLLLFQPKTVVLCKRMVPVRLSNGDSNDISLYITNKYPYPVFVEIIDELPEQFQIRDFYLKADLRPGEEKSFFYRLKPVERGEYQFGHVNIYVSLLLKLVKRRYKSGQPEIVPVYPSYLQMHKYGIFAISDKLTEVGIKKIRRIGHHYEFDQVKEYVKGDDYRTINWKATSRRSQLMVNQYLDERAQCIYCIIDKGRLMEKAFKGMTYLDYAVNSSLVLLNIALQKYDKAGLVTFNTRVDTFLPAERKNTTINKILESLYNQKTSFSESNFELLYVNLKNKIKQRSLLVLYSNFGGLVSLNRNIDYLKGLAKSHLLLFILFKNTEINDLIAKYPSTLEDVYISTIAEKFEYEQKLLAAELNRHGIYTVLTAPENLTLDLINKYFEFKSLGFI